MKFSPVMTRWLATMAALFALSAIGCADADQERAPDPDPATAEAAARPPAAELEEQGVTCGGRICPIGTLCCDPFCGSCAPKGAECTLGCGGGI